MISQDSDDQKTLYGALLTIQFYHNPQRWGGRLFGGIGRLSAKGRFGDDWPYFLSARSRIIPKYFDVDFIAAVFLRRYIYIHPLTKAVAYECKGRSCA
ncbi:hypothetical protein RLEG12_05790 (plasmid) [Rhizobium leguminosarum bv. trifolii CB782]|nr:hypothetical protein RLEG12_05790 [Rhizobium leguminosarum bv. trifolii CB782]